MANLASHVLDATHYSALHTAGRPDRVLAISLDAF